MSLSGVRFPTVYLPGEYLNPTYDPEKTPPWASDNDENNIKIRKALSLAVDRQEIIDFLFGGRGTTEGACVQSFWPAAPGYNPDCEVDGYDPEAALALLAEAGYPDPSQLVIPVDYAEHPQLTYTGAVMQAVAQQWQAALGVQIESSQTDYRTYQALSGQAGAYAAFVYSAPFFDNPCTLLGYYTRTGDFFSYTGESEELNDLMNHCVAQVFPEDVSAAHRSGVRLHLRPDARHPDRLRRLGAGVRRQSRLGGPAGALEPLHDPLRVPPLHQLRSLTARFEEGPGSSRSLFSIQPLFQARHRGIAQFDQIPVVASDLVGRPRGGEDIETLLAYRSEHQPGHFLRGSSDRHPRPQLLPEPAPFHRMTHPWRRTRMTTPGATARCPRCGCSPLRGTAATPRSALRQCAVPRRECG